MCWRIGHLGLLTCNRKGLSIDCVHRRWKWFNIELDYNSSVHYLDIWNRVRTFIVLDIWNLNIEIVFDFCVLSPKYVDQMSCLRHQLLLAHINKCYLYRCTLTTYSGDNMIIWRPKGSENLRINIKLVPSIWLICAYDLVLYQFMFNQRG